MRYSPPTIINASQCAVLPYSSDLLKQSFYTTITSSWKKLCFHKVKFWDFHVKALKMMWNVQKSDLENMSECVCVHACARIC